MARWAFAIAALVLALATSVAGASTTKGGLRVTLSVAVDSDGATYTLSGWQSGDFLTQTCVDGNLQGFAREPAADSIGPLYVFNRCTAYVYNQIDNPDGTFTRTTVSNTVRFHAV